MGESSKLRLLYYGSRRSLRFPGKGLAVLVAALVAVGTWPRACGRQSGAGAASQLATTRAARRKWALGPGSGCGPCGALFLFRTGRGPSRPYQRLIAARRLQVTNPLGSP